MSYYRRINKRIARDTVAQGGTVILTTPSQAPTEGYALSTSNEKALADQAGGKPCTFDEVVDSFEDQVGRVVYYIDVLATIQESN